jgi:hypothetical protein
MMAELGIHKRTAAFHSAILTIFTPEKTQRYTAVSHLLMDILKIRHFSFLSSRSLAKQHLLQLPV